MRRNLFAGKMLSGGFGLSLFTEDDLEQIHFATLEVLKKTGLYIEDKEALRILGDSGAIVDVKNRIVKFPAYLVEDSIGSAPPTVFLAGREDKHDVVLESSRVGFTAFGEGIILVDPHTGERRKPTKADSAISAILLDYLSEIDVNKKVIGAHDVPQQSAHLHIAEILLQNTTKHCFMGPGSGMLLNKIVEMGVAVSGSRSQLKDRPLVSFATCPVSPLKLIKETCEIIMESARSGMMVNVLSMAMAGGSSPISLAGTLVIHNAEVLGGLVLNQCTRKGVPFMYGSSTTAMDMKLAAATVGSPECGMINAAVARLANYYGLPSWVAGG